MENVEIDKVADAIYEAPFVVMAHNRFSEGVKDEDAVFTYGNKACITPPCDMSEYRIYMLRRLLQNQTFGLGKAYPDRVAAFTMYLYGYR